ncbi:hypothetical protein [Geomesophilobacter sediminis]|uniref:Uncharacterized protein n=1 Tax=Geomesophilobacter sediminis TaxID=2798584 RepID=A0A8J7IXX7_9BACT|nr:hypothetical protein [Geomesophilobacter sediminis]MBJ6724877.1 hypothetical protein [Geomesophilobacter sediminis]
MKKLIVLALSLTLLIASQAMARDLRFSSGLAQSEFRDLSKQAGAAISYKNTAPAEPLGILGFDAGVELEAMDINSGSSYWNKAFGNDAPSFLLLPKLRVRKGLPFSIDVGAMYSYVPDSNIKLWGVEVSKAILDGTMATPAWGIRATYSQLAGVNDLSLKTAGIDTSISKGILFLTPYVGAGAVWIQSKAEGHLQQLSNLSNETIYQPRFFAGLKISPLPLFAITAEAEYQVRPIYSLKAALNF